MAAGLRDDQGGAAGCTPGCLRLWASWRSLRIGYTHSIHWCDSEKPVSSWKNWQNKGWCTVCTVLFSTKCLFSWSQLSNEKRKRGLLPHTPNANLSERRLDISWWRWLRWRQITQSLPKLDVSADCHSLLIHLVSRLFFIRLFIDWAPDSCGLCSVRRAFSGEPDRPRPSPWEMQTVKEKLFAFPEEMQ